MAPVPMISMAYVSRGSVLDCGSPLPGLDRWRAKRKAAEDCRSPKPHGVPPASWRAGLVRKCMVFAGWALMLAAGCPLAANLHGAEVVEADLCIYGGTACGVAAAVHAARMGKRAVIAEFGRHLGGIAREFYHRIAQHYAQDSAWKFEPREDYFNSRGGRSTIKELNGPEATMWTFEPHVAETILSRMLEEAKVVVYVQQRLASGEEKGARLTEITMENGKGFRAPMFIDATYEGDLMAKAGVNYTVGREANAQYGESLNGVRAQTPKHQFTVRVDPYLKPGKPESGLLPFIQTEPPGEPGHGDRSVQAYNFRLCYTQTPANRLPHKQPPGCAPARYELLARYLEALVTAGRKPQLSQFWNPIWMPNGKTDINNNGGFSTDFIGENYQYPDADYQTRAKIWQAHEDYTRGFVYFLATSPRVPENLRAEMQSWGPAKDEFLDTGNWSQQLYVREARRMVSDYVMTEHNCRGRTRAEDAVGLAAYTMDSHNCRRIADHGRVENEGDVQVGGFPPYPISYRAIVPKAGQCANLLVPICLSATHIAYGSIRMEPVFMLLGPSAATAAAMAMDAKSSVQDLKYENLRSRLIADGQILAWLP